MSITSPQYVQTFQPLLQEPVPSYGIYIAIFFGALLLIGVAIYTFFPKIVSPEGPVLETPFQAPGSFPDFEIVPQSTQAIQPWYMVPLEERVERVSTYPYRIRVFHDPANPTFY